MELDEFIERFTALREMGYVKSLGIGPTGVGKTLETYLGIQENNFYLPDLGNMKIKAYWDDWSNFYPL